MSARGSAARTFGGYGCAILHRAQAASGVTEPKEACREGNAPCCTRGSRDPGTRSLPCPGGQAKEPRHAMAGSLCCCGERKGNS